MKKLGFLLIILSLTVFFSACPPLLEDDEKDDPSGDVIVSDDTLDRYKWFDILDKIAKEGKFVSLDLSKCSYDEKNELGGLIKIPINGEDFIVFDPFPASSSGKNFIVSIILPVITQAIINAEDDLIIDDEFNSSEKNIENAKRRSAFNSFKNLRKINGDNITFIGNFAFADCTALTEVVFPRVGHTLTSKEFQGIDSPIEDIGKYAFLGCTGLKKIKFNSAAVIGGYAFKDCTSLSEIDFPEVWMIEKNVFEGCKSLVNVFFEEVTEIRDEAFKNCIKLEKAEFNVTPVPPGADPNSGLPGTGTGISYIDPEDYSHLGSSVIFHPSAFTGCKALEVLNVRNAWNVYFAKDVFANTSAALEIYLLDVPNDDNTSFGHPQSALFLGKDVTISVKKVNIIVPTLKLPENTKIYGNQEPRNIVGFIKQNYSNLTEINVIKR